MSVPKESLIVIDPARISVRPEFLRPTAQDKLAVQHDLDEYVSIVRRIDDGCPLVAAHEGRLSAIEGAPFILAAQSPNSRILTIYCRFRGGRSDLDRFALREVDSGSLMKEFDPLETREYVEMVFFRDSLNPSSQAYCEQRIREFFDAATKRPGEFGGEYSWLGPFQWNEAGSRLAWRWGRTNGPGTHLPRLMRLLTDISARGSAIRSWNGLARIPDDPTKLTVPNELPQ